MKVLIVRNNSNAHAIDASLMLTAFLESQGVSTRLVNSREICSRYPIEGSEEAAGCDLAVVLGGDGTILRTAHLVGTSGIPILGINFGNLGFLANPSEEGVVALVAAALSGDVLREERTSLRVDVVCEGDSDVDGGVFDDGAHAACDGRSSGANEDFDPDYAAFIADAATSGSGKGQEDVPCGAHRSFFALNEAAIARGELGRIVDFKLAVAGAPVAAMRGDGVVVATATGSTAYALSAGGPLVAPSFGGLVVVPLAPHTLRSRALVTAPNDVVEVALSGNDAGREACLFVDGELVRLDAEMARITVRKNGDPTVLLRYKHEGFYAHASKVFF